MAEKWLQDMLKGMFQPVSQDDALRIASEALDGMALCIRLNCHSARPDNCRVYQTASEPCWYVYVMSNDTTELPSLCSSRVIMVGKLTGIIHYDGSANDEG